MKDYEEEGKKAYARRILKKHRANGKLDVESLDKDMTQRAKRNLKDKAIIEKVRKMKKDKITDEDRAKMTGNGMARRAADSIIKRKKEQKMRLGDVMNQIKRK